MSTHCTTERRAREGSCVAIPLKAMWVAAALASAAASTASAADPQVAFNNHCRTCHSTDVGDHRLGPSLGGIVGKQAGAQQGYAYSSALSKADFVWTPERLDRFIADPDAVVRGNKMNPYSGIADKAVRGAIVTHLRENGG